MPRGKKEMFNHAHSSLRNVIERTFGVLKLKWRILLNVPSYPTKKQSKIIVACMALHNFIRDSALADRDFELVDEDENFLPMTETSTDDGDEIAQDGDEILQEDINMNSHREEIANGYLVDDKYN
jgi:hypothetical protein